MDRDGGGRDCAMDARNALALPFLCVLATTPEVSERLGKRHKTIAMWAHQMISLVHRWLPDREIKLMGATASSVLELGLHAKTRAADSHHHRPLGCRAP